METKKPILQRQMRVAGFAHPAAGGTCSGTSVAPWVPAVFKPLCHLCEESRRTVVERTGPSTTVKCALEIYGKVVMGAAMLVV